MNNFTVLIRLFPLKQTKVFMPAYLHSSRKQYNGKETGDDGAVKPNTKQKNQEALKKLNDLLNQMLTEDAVSTSKLNLAKPKSKETVKPAKEKEQSLETKIAMAAKDVAKSIGGDVRQTESELLTKLLNPTIAVTTNDNKHTVSENLSEIVRGMKIDRDTKTPEEVSRASQVRNLLQMAKHQSRKDRGELEDILPRRRNIRADRVIAEIEHEKTDLFGHEPLGIFSVQDKPSKEMNKTWRMLHERELNLAVTHPPSNYFQQMILWTQQGKIWKFPIDNEQGMEEEQSIYFAEHIFLEKHLESWCPPKGPIRHFMELVCIGLSKNPYMSVEHKKGHIVWYKDYFSDKKQLLQDVGAIPPDFEINTQERQEG